jgi:hypothetical protein
MESVTAVIPCMTDAERPFLTEALLSVQAQTVRPKILLCVDENNSWVDELLNGLPVSVELLRLPLASAGAIRNQAVDRVDTEFVAMLDGDDAWRPTKVQTQLQAIAQHGWDVVASKHVLIREDGKSFFYGFALEIPMTSSWLGRTQSFRERPFPDIRVGEDVILWRELNGEVRTSVLNSFLLRYRVRWVSLSEATGSKKRKVAYARRSLVPGARPLMLLGSYGANVGLQVRARLRGGAVRD